MEELIEQLSVLLENKVGRLAEVAQILEEADVRIRSMVLADTSEFGILRLIADQSETAYQALKTRGYTAGRTRVAAVGVGENPGGLRSALALLEKQTINVEYMYAFPRCGQENVMVFRFDKTEEAANILRAGGFRVFSPSEI
ncbi:MAG: amino acid-binding protein [Desulfovibrio sp.]|jgi:hypothetical protein|nr:amino acid-binding protein [Desulfovibrio sp.]